MSVCAGLGVCILGFEGGGGGEGVSWFTKFS